MTDMNGWKLLIVEDEPDGQEVVSGILSHFNIAADTVGTAEEAMQLLFNNGDYTGAIIDLMLPGMHGTELIGHIRGNAATASLPCVAITAYHSSAVKQEAIEAGFNAYFAKPLDEANFFRALSDVIAAN